MKTLILAYENACKSLESRILQLREMMKAPDLPQRERDSLEPVSYTHLTLPTIRLV